MIPPHTDHSLPAVSRGVGIGRNMPAIRPVVLVSGIFWTLMAGMVLLPGRMALAADGASTRLAQSSAGESRAPERHAKPARAGAVSVQVFMLTENLARNPEEYIEIEGTRYIYFNSPRLAASARPLAEPKPRYPRGELEQKDGAVLLQLLISERGALERVTVVCSAPMFEKSAIDSVKGIRFKPALGKNGPVKSYLLAEFSYGRGFPCAAVRD